jgi:hypothetical protein
MEQLIIAGTEDTPSVKLSTEDNEFVMSGRSLPEDVTSFYEPILNWIEEFAKNPFKMSFNTKLEYFNTASSKLILDIFIRLEEIEQESGAGIEIIWHYDENDEDMEEAGEEYKELVEDLTFNLVAY